MESRPIEAVSHALLVGLLAAGLTNEVEGALKGLGFTGPVWPIPNFRDPEPFVAVDRAVAGRNLRAELGLGDDIRLVGLVGHLIEQKRPDRALDALETMHTRGEAAHLVVAGDGPLRRWDSAGPTRRAVPRG